MSASHIDIRLFRSIVIAILLFHIITAEAGGHPAPHYLRNSL